MTRPYKEDGRLADQQKNAGGKLSKLTRRDTVRTKR
jgi:hypothetical protein